MTKKIRSSRRPRTRRSSGVVLATRSEHTAEGMRAQAARVRALGYEPRGIVAQFTDGPRKISCDLKALYTAHSADLYAALGRVPTPAEVIGSGGRFAELFDTLTATNRRRYILQAIELAGGPPHLEGGVSSRLRDGGFTASAARGKALLAALPRGHGDANQPAASEIDELATLLEADGYFDPGSYVDERRRILREIAQRQGERRFRRKLLRAYNARCAVSGCDAVEALEACHIWRYLGPKSNWVANGLLLRADIHTLFDRDLIGIEPDSLRIDLAESLRGTSYEEFRGRKLSVPHQIACRPSIEAIRHRWERFRKGR